MWQDPFGDALCDGASHKTIQAMTHENHVMQIFIFQHADDILNVRVHVNVGIMQMGTLCAKARECNRMDFMPGGAQEGCDFFPAPAAVPHAVNKNEAATMFFLPWFLRFSR